MKEYHLSQLRGIEVQLKRRELYPLPWRAICFSAFRHLRTRFIALRDELEQEFGMELAAILRARPYRNMSSKCRQPAKM